MTCSVTLPKNEVLEAGAPVRDHYYQVYCRVRVQLARYQGQAHPI